MGSDGRLDWGLGRGVGVDDGDGGLLTEGGKTWDSGRSQAQGTDAETQAPDGDEWTSPLSLSRLRAGCQPPTLSTCLLLGPPPTTNWKLETGILYLHLPTFAHLHPHPHPHHTHVHPQPATAPSRPCLLAPAAAAPAACPLPLPMRLGKLRLCSAGTGRRDWTVAWLRRASVLQGSCAKL